MVIRNALVYDESFRPFSGDVMIRHGRIAAVGQRLEEPLAETIDARGARLTPGFVDIHIHGALGRDVADAAADSLDAISLTLAGKGVTSFCPTTAAMPPEALEQSARAVTECMGHERGARICGVHLEGPFISQAMCRGRHARWPSLEEFRRLRDIAPISMISLAPELPGALELARQAAPFCRVSMAHTMASYEEALAAIDAGFSHAAHLFCAMPALHHRAPGAAGAVLEDPRVTAELIADGVHLHPAAVRLAMRLLGEDRAVLVSDSVAAAGLPEGRYTLGGVAYHRKNNAVYLENGTLAGSSCSLYDEFRNLLAWTNERAALKSVTINPAKVIGKAREIGSVAPGKIADLLLLDDDWSLRSVIINGRLFDPAAA